MKITKQQLKQIIKEEIKSLQEGSPFEEKAKEAQNAWLASRPWTANALEVIRKSKSRPDVDDVPSALLRFIEGGEKNIPEKNKAARHALGKNPKYNHDWIRGGLQGDNGGKILKIINDAFEISKTIPLKPFASGLGKGPDRANPLSMDPLISPPQLAKDPDGYKYITFATKSGSWVVIETPPTLNRDQPGIAIGEAPETETAPAGQGLAENKMKLTKQQLKQIIKEEIQNVQEEKSYPNPSTMRKLVKQAKMDGRYKEEDVEKLKKAYDKHVRGTLRDPKHSQAHKKKVNETQLDVVPIHADVDKIVTAMRKKPSYLKDTIIYQLNAAKKMGYKEKAQRVIDALGWTEEAANHWSAE